MLRVADPDDPGVIAGPRPHDRDVATKVDEPRRDPCRSTDGRGTIRGVLPGQTAGVDLHARNRKGKPRLLPCQLPISNTWQYRIDLVEIRHASGAEIPNLPKSAGGDIEKAVADLITAPRIVEER